MLNVRVKCFSFLSLVQAIILKVLGELPRRKFPHEKFPLVKLPREKFRRGEFPRGIFHRVKLLAEDSPVFINAFFIHHSLKMNLPSHKI